ncbi:hypothetical protein AYX15_07067 [Cryptococcus neoformans]|nr:hypothetical protein AYX15_07067 [Cryptococcus neoformans var. grubii]
MPQAPHHQKESISHLFEVVAVGDEALGRGRPQGLY